MRTRGKRRKRQNGHQQNKPVTSSHGPHQHTSTRTTSSSISAPTEGRDSNSSRTERTTNTVKQTENANAPGASASSHSRCGNGHRQHQRNRNQNRRWNQNRRHRMENDRSSQSRSSYDCGENQDGEETLEIPGFYYDKEKKTYFKILPNHSTVSGAVTRDALKTKRVENKRLNDLAKYSTSASAAIPQSTHIKKRKKNSGNIFSAITNRDTGTQTQNSINTMVNRYFLRKLVLRGQTDAVQTRYHVLDMVENINHMILSNDSKMMVGIWFLADCAGDQRMHQTSFHHVKKTGTSGEVDFEVDRVYCAHTLGNSRVTSFRWAPQSPDQQPEKRYLYTMTENTLHHGVAQGNVCLQGTVNVFQQQFYDTGPQAVWTSAWDTHHQRFSVGNEQGSLVVDAETREMTELNCDNSLVLAQEFSKACVQLFSGTRRGEVFCHDLRSRSTRAIYSLRHGKNVSGLYQARDERTLTVADVTGKIQKWDLRQRQVVHDFPGHVNEHVCTPFQVDARERVLYAVGQDCYTRLWCYQTGALLHTIPSPCPISTATIPRVALTEGLGGPGGLPGLLMAVRDQLHFYTY